MKGQKFLQITGILMIISAIFSLLASLVVGGLGALAAGLGAASGLTLAYWAALFLTLGGGICRMIAGIKGIRHSGSHAESKKLVVGGIIAAVFSVLGMVMNMVNSGEFSLTGVLTGAAVPALYIYGAVLNSKSDDSQYMA